MSDLNPQLYYIRFKDIPYMEHTIQAIKFKTSTNLTNGTNTTAYSSSMSPTSLYRQNSTKSSFKSLSTFTNTSSTKISSTNATDIGNNTQIYSSNIMAQSTIPSNAEYHAGKLNNTANSPNIQRNEPITTEKTHKRHKRHHKCMFKPKSKCSRNGLFRHLDNENSQIFKSNSRAYPVPMTYPVQNAALITRSMKSKPLDSVHLTGNQKSYLDSQIWKSLRDSPQTLLFYLYGPDAKNLSLWQAEQSLEPSKLSDGGFVLSLPGYKDIIDSSTNNSFDKHYYHQCHVNPTLLKLKKMLILGLRVIRDGTWNTRMSITDFHRLLYLIEHPVFNSSKDAFTKLRYRMACLTKDHRNEIQDWIDKEGIAAAVPENVLWLNPIKRYLRNHWKDLIRSICCDPNSTRL